MRDEVTSIAGHTKPLWPRAPLPVELGSPQPGSQPGQSCKAKHG